MGSRSKLVVLPSIEREFETLLRQACEHLRPQPKPEVRRVPLKRGATPVAKRRSSAA